MKKIIFLIIFLIILFGFSQKTISVSKGDLTNFNGKWGWTETDEVFVPQLVMYDEDINNFYNNPSKIDADIQEFIVEHGFNGFHVVPNCRWYDINQSKCQSGDSTPDQATFDALKLLIEKTHAAGGMVHLWMWGDEERATTPTVIWTGGVLSNEAKRVYDKIGQEMGSIPGWTMGLGFDLDEWVTASELENWNNYMQGLVSPGHFFGGRPAGPNSGTDHSAYISWNQELDYSSYEHHKPSYNVYVASLNAIPNKPTMSEDRFRITGSGSKNYNEIETRRGMWKSAMAGGVANIWGNLIGGSYDTGSEPYPNKDQIKTYSRFFENRFKKDMVRCSELTNSGTRCLRNQAKTQFIFYRNGGSQIEMKLSGMNGAQSAVAVDAMKSYAEVNLGTIDAKNQFISPPSGFSSEWAIAVGNFGSTVCQSKCGSWSDLVNQCGTRTCTRSDCSTFDEDKSCGQVGTGKVSITNLNPSNYQISTLSSGDSYFIDRTYSLVNLPSKYSGLTLIKTANDDKQSGTGVGFNIDIKANVYVAYDPRLNPPTWLSSSFTKTGDVIDISDSQQETFEVWKKEFPAGSVNLGINGVGAEEGSMYIVFVEGLEELIIGCGFGSGNDVNNDNEIDLLDLICVANGFGGSDDVYDINNDQKIDILDIIIIAKEIGNG